jgi:hypothetical protein
MSLNFCHIGTERDGGFTHGLLSSVVTGDQFVGF